MTGTYVACLHRNQSRSYLNHLVIGEICICVWSVEVLFWLSAMKPKRRSSTDQQTPWKPENVISVYLQINSTDCIGLNCSWDMAYSSILTYLMHTENSIVWLGYMVAQLVEALCYKPEGCSFDSRWGCRNFQGLQLSGCTMAVGLTKSVPGG